MNNWIKEVAKKINEREGFFMFMRAQFTSNISGLTDILASFLLVNLFGIYYVTATFLANVFGGMMSCFLNYRWTFKAKGINAFSVALKFLLVWIVSINLNTFGTMWFTEFVMQYIPVTIWPPNIVENVFMAPRLIVSIAVGLLWNYPMHRDFVYKDRNLRKYLKKVRIKS
jgi:putative flippase GtrA